MRITTPTELRDNLKDKGFSYVEYMRIREYAKLFKAKSITIKDSASVKYDKLYR